MEQLIPILIEFLKDNPYFALATSIIAAASALAAATPTPKEGTVWAKLYFVIDFLALNILNAKDKGEK
jgi:hypothetical protein